MPFPAGEFCSRADPRLAELSVLNQKRTEEEMCRTLWRTGLPPWLPVSLFLQQQGRFFVTPLRHVSAGNSGERDNF
jgi:hypothetical protein